MVNAYAVQSGGCRFESLWGFGSFLKGAHYQVDYCGKKTSLAGLQCTLTSSCAKMGFSTRGPGFNKMKFMVDLSALFFSIFFLDLGDIKSIIREEARNAIKYRLKILFKRFLHQSVS